MKKLLLLFLPLLTFFSSAAQNIETKIVAKNAVRIRCGSSFSLPDWIYVQNGETTAAITVTTSNGVTTVKNSDGKTFTALEHRFDGKKASMKFQTSDGEFLFGLGQFQDGYSNVNGLSRRLTQVNTQISVPVIISDRGYGILWNNYAKTDFNPLPQSAVLKKDTASGKTEIVNVTSTEGGKQEVRKNNVFTAEIFISEAGQYSLLLDVGQKMARRHNLEIDGKTVIEMQNLWLPPTASAIVELSEGRHVLKAELTENDKPVLHFGKVKNENIFQSEPSDFVDYTVIFGTADEIIKTYRDLTGNVPLIPAWALGYIHCRERFHSQDEIIKTADRFAAENIPLDMIVQDWQYWGKNGWNSMVFDAENYPDPKALTDYLHSKNVKMMLSVWSKIDKNSTVGKEMAKSGFYIPNTDWIDFFNPEAAAAYWKNFREKLLPAGIDAWWQDATEPENDDLENRLVNNGKTDGNLVRNVYPVLVNKTVFEGLKASQPEKRPMILTRSGFLGIQRYGSALWSGDIGNDWETLRRQITGGLGLQASGVPWWTYDAGGFFRPYDQYKNQDYINRMLRWIELSVYLPLMRVHGYMSDTEPWNYGDDAKAVIKHCIEERKRLFPYIYSNAAEVSFEGSTLMRPLVFDFSGDKKALVQKYEYMFGKALLISPVTEPDVTQWKTYLPENKGGWYDFYTGRHFDGGQTVITEIDKSKIPVFAKAGGIVVTKDEVKIFPGQNAEFVLYTDDGESNKYENGEFCKTKFTWNDAKKTLTVENIGGKVPSDYVLTLKLSCREQSKNLTFNGKKKTVKF